MESSGQAEKSHSSPSKRSSKDSSKRRSKPGKSSRDGERSKEHGKESSRRSSAQKVENNNDDNDYDIVPTVKDFQGMRKVSRLGFEDPVDLARQMADTKPSRDLKSPREKANHPRSSKVSGKREESKSMRLRPSSSGDIKKASRQNPMPRRTRSKDLDFSAMFNIQEGDELVVLPVVIKPAVAPPTPTTQPPRPSCKVIELTPQQRALMRQVSGLGLEDPVFGTNHESSTRPRHPPNVFEDMDIADVPEGMKEMLSIFSDHTDPEPVAAFDKHAMNDSNSNSDSNSPMPASPQTKDKEMTVESSNNDGFDPPMGGFVLKSSNKIACPSSPATHPNLLFPFSNPAHASNNNKPKLPRTNSGTKRSRPLKNSADSPQHGKNNAMWNNMASAAKEELVLVRSPKEHKTQGSPGQQKDKSPHRYTTFTYESPAYVRQKLLNTTSTTPAHSRRDFLPTGGGEVYVPPQSASTKMREHGPESSPGKHRALPSMTEALSSSLHEQQMSDPFLRAEEQPTLGKSPLNHVMDDQQLVHSSKRKEKTPTLSNTSSRRQAGRSESPVMNDDWMPALFTPCL
jgi:hypothetical protein